MSKNNKQSFSPNKFDIVDVNAKVAIATGLALIALLLAYIAFFK